MTEPQSSITVATPAEHQVVLASKFGPDECLSWLIHAGAKVGKSTLAATAPGPILAIDAEGSWKFLPLRRVNWDPVAGPPPAYDGTWDVCVVTATSWEIIVKTLEWLQRYLLPFTSVIVDSITELQSRCKKMLRPITESMREQDWGMLLALMDDVIRGYRDLTLNRQLSIRCVVFVAETRQDPKSGMWMPYMQGQVGVRLPYMVDVWGYLYPDWLPDEYGQLTRPVRRFWVEPHPQFGAGNRVQGRLGTVLTIPKPADGTVGTDITQWMNAIFGRAPAITSEPEAARIITPSNGGSTG